MDRMDVPQKIERPENSFANSEALTVRLSLAISSSRAWTFSHCIMADYLIKLKKLKFTVLSFAPPVTGEDAEGFLFDAAQFRFVYTDASMIWNREGEPACGVGVYFNAANPS